VGWFWPDYFLGRFARYRRWRRGRWQLYWIDPVRSFLWFRAARGESVWPYGKPSHASGPYEEEDWWE
jgi:hypothetical protein